MEVVRNGAMTGTVRKFQIKMNNDEYYYFKYEEEFTNKLAREWDESENSN